MLTINLIGYIIYSMRFSYCFAVYGNQNIRVYIHQEVWYNQHYKQIKGNKNMKKFKDFFK